jgi:hypothetical protein
MNDAEQHQYGTEAADRYDETDGVPVRRWASSRRSWPRWAASPTSEYWI